MSVLENAYTAPGASIVKKTSMDCRYDGRFPFALPAASNAALMRLQ
jgi:hypothetical protein